MFNTTNFEKISDHAYIWRGFLDNETCDEAFKISEDASKNNENEIRPYDKIEVFPRAVIDDRIKDKAKAIFKDLNWEVKYFLNWHTPANTWFSIHRDNEADDETPYTKVWSAVIYLSETNPDGGIVFYPEENLTVKPHKGDLLIHAASCPHGATPVTTSNKRTITFNLYDRDLPVDPTNTSGKDNSCIDVSNRAHEESTKTINKILTLTDWLDTDIGKAWVQAYLIY